MCNDYINLLYINRALSVVLLGKSSKDGFLLYISNKAKGRHGACRYINKTLHQSFSLIIKPF